MGGAAKRYRRAALGRIEISHRHRCPARARAGVSPPVRKRQYRGGNRRIRKHRRRRNGEGTHTGGTGPPGRRAQARGKFRAPWPARSSSRRRTRDCGRQGKGPCMRQGRLPLDVHQGTCVRRRFSSAGEACRPARRAFAYRVRMGPVLRRTRARWPHAAARLTAAARMERRPSRRRDAHCGGHRVVRRHQRSARHQRSPAACSQSGRGTRHHLPPQRSGRMGLQHRRTRKASAVEVREHAAATGRSHGRRTG